MGEKIYHLGVKVLIFNAAREFLVLKVDQTGFQHSFIENYWDIPGGRVQEGETAEETLRREVAEETGLNLSGDMTPFEMALSNIEIPLESGAQAGLVLSVYTASIPQVDALRLSPEHTDFKWASSQEAARLLAHKYPASFLQKFLSVFAPQESQQAS